MGPVAESPRQTPRTEPGAGAAPGHAPGGRTPLGRRDAPVERRPAAPVQRGRRPGEPGSQLPQEDPRPGTRIARPQRYVERATAWPCLVTWRWIASRVFRASRWVAL